MSDETPTTDEVRGFYVCGTPYWIDGEQDERNAEFDRWLAEHDRQVLRDHAAWLREQYPEDIFRPPSAARITEVHRAFGIPGLSVDQWTAHIMRHAANVAEHRADAIQVGGKE
jgi:hypothetical protein